MFETNTILSINKTESQIEINELPRDPFIPISVYKAFIRMAIALMKRDELCNFKTVIDWLLEKNHNFQIENVCPRILYSFIPGNAPPNTVLAALARRCSDNLDHPYMVFMLIFSNYAFQVFLPSPKSLQNSEFIATVMPHLFGARREVVIQPSIVDLGGTETVKNEMVPFHIGFGSITDTHTSLEQNIATRAYFLWKARGSDHGDHLSDWFLAEEQIHSEMSKQLLSKKPQLRK